MRQNQARCYVEEVCRVPDCSVWLSLSECRTADEVCCLQFSFPSLVSLVIVPSLGLESLVSTCFCPLPLVLFLASSLLQSWVQWVESLVLFLGHLLR